MAHSRPTAGNGEINPHSGFFIPDLCAPTALLLAVLLAELVVLLHVLALGPLESFNWQRLAVGSVFVQWNALLSIAVLCRLRRLLVDWSPVAAAAVCLSTVALITGFSSGLVYSVYPLLLADSGSLIDWLLRNVTIASILAAVVLRYSYLQQRVAIQQRSELQLRLDALQARIRPHFLFNTLNSIASLIAIQPDRAEQAVEDVAELFRAALQDDGHDSTLDEEIHLCALYLELETLRLGERLVIDWQIGDELRDETFPALLLQPLVENAVYHGIAQRPDGGTIAIRAARVRECLEISVINPLPERPTVPAGSGQRMALENIRQRLEARYGDAAGLETESEGGEFRARIFLPLGEPAA